MKGKNKEQFEAWYNQKALFQNVDKGILPSHVELFYGYPHEMKEGVIIAYYDSLGVYIFTDWSTEVDWMYNVEIREKINLGIGGYPSRKEATLAAFEEADELINKQL